MKRVSLALAFLCFVFIIYSGFAHAQVSFFQPPTFPDGNGPLFVADFNGDGKPDLLCSYGCLDLGNGDGTFKAIRSPTGTVLAVADFNGDNKPDLLEEGTNAFSVLLGNGDGTFQSPITTATGGTLELLAAADLDGDGHADVVGVYGAVLYVFIGNGDGTFKSGVPYNLGTASPVTGTLSFADFNGDGKKDIALNIYASPQQEVVVLLGNGDGTFQAPKTSTGVPPTPACTVVGDFNGDGKLDLVSTLSNASSVYLQLGNGDGTFQPATAAFSNSGQFAAADLRGDGKLDLIFANIFSTNQRTEPSSQIYLGNGDGTFSQPSSYVSNFPAGTPDGSLVIADFNSDGKLDIASSGGILLGNGDGSFQGIPLVTVSPQPVSAVAGDFEKNGKPDAAVVSPAPNNNQTSYLYILHNSGKGQLSLLHTYPLSAPGFQILVGDLNGDGNLDLVVIQTWLPPNSPGYSVLLGNGDGSFQSPSFYPGNASFESATLVDVNNDKKLDLVEGGGMASVGISLGNGDGTFGATVQYDDLNSWGSTLLTGDFSGHGNVDIGVPPPYRTPGTVMLYGNGDGTFQAAIIPVDLNTYMADSTWDFRNIGRADLFNGSVALNNGDGTFTFLPALPYSGFPVANINGNGKVDILIPNMQQGQTGCQAAVALGNGDGTFGSPTDIPGSACYPFSPSYPNGELYTADMNGDGLPDVLFLWGTGVGVLLNMTAPLAPDFSISAASGSSTKQSVTAGQAASFNVAFAPIGSFTGTVSLSCAVTPVVTPAPTCSVPSSVQISASGTQTVIVKVGTTAPVTSTTVPHGTFPVGPMPLAWTLMFVASAWLWGRNRKRLPALAAPIVVLAFMFAIGCGGNGSSSSTSGTPAGTYTATITATSGSTTHNMALQVVVQ